MRGCPQTHHITFIPHFFRCPFCFKRWKHEGTRIKREEKTRVCPNCDLEIIERIMELEYGDDRIDKPAIK